MTIFSKGINVTSVNAGVSMFTLTSTDEERKKALRIVYSLVETHEATLDVLLEREKIVDTMPIELLAVTADERIVLLDIEIPVGQTLQGVLKPETAGEQQIFHGFLEYEILG